MWFRNGRWSIRPVRGHVPIPPEAAHPTAARPLRGPKSKVSRARFQLPAQGLVLVVGRTSLDYVNSGEATEDNGPAAPKLQFPRTARQLSPHSVRFVNEKRPTIAASLTDEYQADEAARTPRINGGKVPDHAPHACCSCALSPHRL